MKQQKLFTEKTKSFFGGNLLKNAHARSSRPFSGKAAMHITIKAHVSCLKHYDRRIETIIEKQAKRHYIKIYHLQNVGNHMHLVLKSKRKDLLQNFLRAICGLIPRRLKTTKLWIQRPFSRIIRWGRDYKNTKNYMTINKYQALGFSKEEARFMMKLDRGDYGREAG